MAELERDAITLPPQRGPLFYLGAIGLVVLMVVGTLAVLGRHVGRPFLGAIEIIQAAILLMACASVVIATISEAHAAVHLLTDRLAAKPKHSLAKLAAFLSAIFFIGLTVGGVWLAMDYWHAHEESEVLHIPFRPLRALTALTMASIACVYLYRTFRSSLSHKPASDRQ